MCKVVEVKKGRMETFIQGILLVSYGVIEVQGSGCQEGKNGKFDVQKLIDSRQRGVFLAYLLQASDVSLLL